MLFFISVDNIHYIHYVQMPSGGVGGRVEYKPPYALMSVSTRSLGIWNMETRSFVNFFIYYNNMIPNPSCGGCIDFDNLSVVAFKVYVL
jgi:hypothetical protein